MAQDQALDLLSPCEPDRCRRSSNRTLLGPSAVEALTQIPDRLRSGSSLQSLCKTHFNYLLTSVIFNVGCIFFSLYLQNWFLLLSTLEPVLE